MQDNTGRFDDEDNFDCDGNTPPTWKPWTHSPLAGQFNIAFEVDPTREVVSFFIRYSARCADGLWLPNVQGRSIGSLTLQ
jgi:hypothetical protein